MKNRHEQRLGASSRFAASQADGEAVSIHPTLELATRINVVRGYLGDILFCPCCLQRLEKAIIVNTINEQRQTFDFQTTRQVLARPRSCPRVGTESGSSSSSSSDMTNQTSSGSSIA